MLLTSVILILQETLEAALLISVLAAISIRLGHRITWLPLGMLVGSLLAWAYAANIRRVSEWFDYVGQEIVNATLQMAIAAALILLTRLVSAKHGAVPPTSGRTGSHNALLFSFCAAASIGLTITREGSEILTYLVGFLQQGDKRLAVLIGSGVGFGIGASIGVLIFYGLMALRGRFAAWLPLILLALFCGNMLAQSALQLTQADLLQSGPALWDSSSLLPEDSVAGRLLYALVGYESRPSAAQVACYMAGASAVILSALLGRRPS